MFLPTHICVYIYIYVIINEVLGSSWTSRSRWCGPRSALWPIITICIGLLLLVVVVVVAVAAAAAVVVLISSY